MSFYELIVKRYDSKVDEYADYLERNGFENTELRKEVEGLIFILERLELTELHREKTKDI